MPRLMALFSYRLLFSSLVLTRARAAACRYDRHRRTLPKTARLRSGHGAGRRQQPRPIMPADRRGAGLALYGIAGGVPAIARCRLAPVRGAFRLPAAVRCRRAGRITGLAAVFQLPGKSALPVADPLAPVCACRPLGPAIVLRPSPWRPASSRPSAAGSAGSSMKCGAGVAHAVVALVALACRTLRRPHRAGALDVAA